MALPRAESGSIARPALLQQCSCTGSRVAQPRVAPKLVARGDWAPAVNLVRHAHIPSAHPRPALVSTRSAAAHSRRRRFTATLCDATCLITPPTCCQRTHTPRGRNGPVKHKTGVRSVSVPTFHEWITSQFVGAGGSADLGSPNPVLSLDRFLPRYCMAGGLVAPFEKYRPAKRVSLPFTRSF